MPFFRTKDAQKTPLQIIVENQEPRDNKGRGGESMNRLIARLIDCGMTREVAVFMARKYRGRPRDFELYVETVEEANREQMDRV